MKFKKLWFLSLFLFLVVGCSTDPGTSGTSGNKIDKSQNLRSLGDSAHQLLSDDTFTSISIEVVYVTGYKPSTSTLSNLKQFLIDRTYKPDGINITTRAVTSSGKAPFNIDEIAKIETDERLIYNTGDDIAVYIYFADGSNEDDTSSHVVLGSAYRNTSIVIYGKTVNQIAANYNAPDKSIIESTTLEHEFGHLFGLVNVGTPMQSPHKDPDSEAHCNVQGCLMNANIQFGGGIVDVINNNHVIPFDDLCLADLQANGGK